MKKVILGFAIIVSCLSFGQKVKIKKGFVSIDDKTIYKFERSGYTSIVSTLNGKEFLSINTNSYETDNPSRYSSIRTIDNFIHTVRFLDSDKEFTTNLSYNDICLNIYKSNLINSEDGKLDEDKVNIFIKKYNNEDLKLKLFK